MSVGTTLGLASSVRPVQRIAGFLVSKNRVGLTVTLDVGDVPFHVPVDAQSSGHDVLVPAWPRPAQDVDPGLTVPLIRLAWGRGGDKGNLFNVAVIAHDALYLPYIASALTPEKVGAHYALMLGQGEMLPVEAYSAPGFFAPNFVVKNAMEGGVLASTWIDSVAKGMAQLLLDYPIPLSRAVHDRLVALR